jgi:serpin B
MGEPFMRRIRRLAVAAPLAMLSMTAAGEQPVRSTPPVDQTDLPALVRGNTQFALDLYAELCGQTEDNVFFAPQSISTALAMSYAGARAETARQMRETLHFDLDQDRLHPAFAALTASLASGAAGPETLALANRLWAHEDEPFLPSYLQTIRAHYAGGIETVDFLHETEAARAAINEWTAQHTGDRIEELFQRGQIDPATSLVIVNAVHFKGTWWIKFDPARTRNAEFHVPGHPADIVPMMNLSGDFDYYESDLLQALKLPYDGDRLEMIILLPAARDGLPRLESALHAGNLAEWLGGMSTQTVNLSLPRFSTRSRFELSKTLATMGMPAAFSIATADFSGMNGRRYDLAISTVVHEAFIAVDEAGTEAAAATGIVHKRNRPRGPARLISYP